MRARCDARGYRHSRGSRRRAARAVPLRGSLRRRARQAGARRPAAGRAHVRAGPHPRPERAEPARRPRRRRRAWSRSARSASCPTRPRSPASPGSTASRACSATRSATTALDWGGCPRGFLRRAVDALAAAGLRVEAAFENEFYLRRGHPGRPATVGRRARSTPRPGSTGPRRSSTTSSTRSTPRASRSSRRSTSTGPASRRSRSPAPTRSPPPTASCSCATPCAASPRPATACSPRSRPKPYAEHVGSGCHLHFSLWDGDRNADRRPDGDPFGALRHGAGVPRGRARSPARARRADLPVLHSPTPGCSRARGRPRPSSWGFDNREAALRDRARRSAGREDVSPNAELKTCDASSNPHLALGGLVLAGLDGLDRELTLPEPAAHDPAHLDAEAAPPLRHPAAARRPGGGARRAGGRHRPHGRSGRPARTLRARDPPGRVRALRPDGRRGRSESDFRGALAGACCRGTPRGTPGRPPP